MSHALTVLQQTVFASARLGLGVTDCMGRGGLSSRIIPIYWKASLPHQNSKTAQPLVHPYKVLMSRCWFTCWYTRTNRVYRGRSSNTNGLLSNIIFIIYISINIYVRYLHD